MHAARLRSRLKIWMEDRCKGRDLLDVDMLLDAGQTMPLKIGEKPNEALREVVEEMLAVDAVYNSPVSQRPTQIDSCKLEEAIYSTIIENFEKYSSHQ